MRDPPLGGMFFDKRLAVHPEGCRKETPNHPRTLCVVQLLQDISGMRWRGDEGIITLGRHINLSRVFLAIQMLRRGMCLWDETPFG